VFAPFLMWVTVARTVASMLPVGLFFAAAADPRKATRVIGLASTITLGTGLALWPSGRLLDRLGRWRGIRACLSLGAVTLLLLSAGVAWSWPVAVLALIAVAAGAFLAPLVSTPRAVLPELVAPQRLAWASGVEASSFEVALIIAPVAAAMVGRFGAVAVLTTAAGALLVVRWLFPRPTRMQRSSAGDGPLLAWPVVGLAGLAALLGASGGMLEPALAQLPAPVVGLAGSNALLFVAVGLGSLAGGLLAARTGWPASAGHAAPLFALHAVALIATATMPGALRLVTLAVAGLPIAPLTSLAGLHLDRWAQSPRVGETFGIITAVLFIATSIGQAIAAGALAHIPAEQLVLWAAVPAAAAAVFVASCAGDRRPR
jgi:hypothetical protein